MPRRKEGLDYELLPRPTRGEDGRPLLYARPAVGIRYSMSSLEAFCHQHRGMHYGEMTRALEVFLDVATILMEDGARIETPFGTFAPKLRLDGDYTDPDKVTGNNVHYAGVEFRPSQQFIERLGDRVGLKFRKVGIPSGTEQLSDSTTMDEALRRSLTKGYTTVNRFCYCSGLKYHTAKRYLNSLCEGDNPLLRRTLEGRNWHYALLHPTPDK